MNVMREMAPSGRLGLVHIKADPFAGRKSTSLMSILLHALPRPGLGRMVNAWRLRNMWRVLAGALPVWTACAIGVATIHGTLFLRVLRADGQVQELGLAGFKVVTTAGVGFIVDAFQNIVEPEIMKFHGIGTGNTAENVADTTLVTESTTALLVDSTRATGTLAEGATGNIFRSVGTITVDASVAAVEHGLFTTAATGTGVLLDRTVFSVVNLANGDSLQATYEITFTAGS